MYNTSGNFKTGYKAVSVRIEDNATNTYVETAALTWMPLMQMPSTAHSCPKSAINKGLGKDTVYEGFIVYQMTNLDGSGWDLIINYTINGVDYKVSSNIVVLQREKPNVISFMATDEAKHVIAMVAPKEPKIAVNKIKAVLFKMESVMSFTEVEGYKIILDPRMPDMGNHSSPNNTDLTYNAFDRMYDGKLSLTMTS